jgi:RHS repeat-associated protein
MRLNTLEQRTLLSAPHVIDTAFAYDTLPHRVSFQFDQDVSASLSTSDLYVHRYGFDAVRYASSYFSLSYDHATNVATFTRTGTGKMATGYDYSATLYADDVTNAAGEPLAATSSFDFFYMSGDANHDRASNQADIDIVLQSEASPPNPVLYSTGDFDYSGSVDATDESFVVWDSMRRLRKYGSTLSVWFRPDGKRELQWVDDCPYDNGYVIQACTDGKNFETWAETAPGETSFVDEWDPGTNYYYRIRAKLGSNESAIERSGFSAVKSAVSGNALPTPGGISVTGVAHNEATLHWADNGNTGGRYEVLKSNPAGGWEELDASDIANSNGENTLVVQRLNALQSYTFIVRAISDDGVSRPVSTTITTPSGPPAVLDSRIDVDHLPHQIAVWFDQPVTALGGLSAADGELRMIPSGVSIPLTNLQLSADGRFVYASASVAPPANWYGPSGVWSEGYYELVIHEGKLHNSAGQYIGSTSAPGNEVVAKAHFLIADVNNDTFVNFSDLLAVAQNYNQSGLLYSQGDITYDTLVNFDDLLYLAARYNTSLLAPPDSPGELVANLPVGEGADTYHSIAVSWESPTAAAGDYEGFDVFRSVNGNDFSVVARVGRDVRSYLDEGLNEGKRYWYRIRSYRTVNSATQYSYTSNRQSAITVLPMPESFAVRSLGNGNLSLTWKDRSANETGFAIDRLTEGTDPTDPDNWIRIATTAANASSATDTNVSAAERYLYRVSAFTSQQSSAPAMQTIDATLAVPDDLAATAEGSDAVHVGWTYPEGAVASITGFVVQRSIDGSTWTTIGQPATNDVADGAGRFEFIDGQLIASTTYRYRVAAAGSASWVSPFSVSDAVVTTGAVRTATLSGGATGTAPYNATVTLTVSDTSGLSDWVVHWDDGTDDVLPISQTTATHSFAYGSRDYQVTATVGRITTAPVTFQLAGPAAPTVAVTQNSASIAEGAAGSFTFSVAGVPTNDTDAQFIVDWGDGSDPVQHLRSDLSGSGALTLSHTFVAGVGASSVQFSLVRNGATFASAGVDVTLVPASHSNLAASLNADGLVTLGWTTGSALTAVTRVQRSTDGVTWSTIADDLQSSTEFVDLTAPEGASLRYRVVAVNGATSASPSNVALISTPIASASDLAAASTGPTSLALSWNDNSQLETGYRIELSSDGGTSFTTVVNLGPDATTYPLTGLVANQAYTVRLTTLVAAGNTVSAAPLVLAVRTDLAGQVPSPAADVAASYIGALSVVRVTWTYQGANVSTYDVQRSDQGGPWTTRVANLDAATYDDTGIELGHTYAYRVIARNGYGDAQPSDVVYAARSVAAPTNLVASVENDGTVTLTWIDASANEQGFRLYEVNAQGQFTLIRTLPADADSVRLDDIGPGQSDYQTDPSGAAIPRTFAISAYSEQAESTKTASVSVTPKLPRIEVVGANVIVSPSYTVELRRIDTTPSTALTWTIDWGDGNEPEVVSQAQTGNTQFTVTHQFALAIDGNPRVYQIVVSASTSDGETTYAAEPITLTYAPPPPSSVVTPGTPSVSTAKKRQIISAFEWVYNNIAFSPYTGYKKGPDATKATRAGNAWDIAVLAKRELDNVIDHSGGANIELVLGHVSAPIELVKKWLGLGPGADGTAARDLLSFEEEDRVNARRTDTGVPITMGWTHVWLRVTIPGWIDTPIEIDPSWKFREIRTWHGGLGVDPSAQFHELPDPNDQTGMPGFWKQTRENPLEYFESQLGRYIQRDTGSNGMSGHTSLADLAYLGPVKTRSFDALPNLGDQDPSEVYTRPATTTVVDFDAQSIDNAYHVEVQIAGDGVAQDVSYNGSGRQLSNATTPMVTMLLPDIGSEPLTIRYTIEDRFTYKLQGSINPTWKLEPQQFLVAHLYVGETMARDLATGKAQDLFVKSWPVKVADSKIKVSARVWHKWRNVETDRVFWYRTLGDPVALMVDSQQVSRGDVARVQERANAQASAVSISETALQQSYQAKLLSVMAMDFVSQADVAAEALAGYTNTSFSWGHSVGLGLITGVSTEAGAIVRSDATSGLINPYIFYDPKFSKREASDFLPSGGSATIYTDIKGGRLPIFVSLDDHLLPGSTLAAPIQDFTRSNEASIVYATQRSWLESDTIERMTNIEAYSTTKVFQSFMTDTQAPAVYEFMPNVHDSVDGILVPKGHDVTGATSAPLLLTNLFKDHLPELGWPANSLDITAARTIFDMSTELGKARDDDSGLVYIVPNRQIANMNGRSTVAQERRYAGPYDPQSPGKYRITGIGSLVFDAYGSYHGGLTRYANANNNFNNFNILSPTGSLQSQFYFPQSDAVNLSALGGGVLGDPVNMISGAVYHDEHDFTVPLPGMSVPFERHYDSSITDDYGFGKGWLFSYGDRVNRDGDVALWVSSKGEQYRFRLNSTTQTWENPSGVFGTFTSDGNGYKYVDKDGSQRTFDVWGRLHRVVDRIGNGVEVRYAGRSKLLNSVYRIDAQSGQPSAKPILELAWTDTGTGGNVTARKLTLSDFLGRVWKYELNTAASGGSTLYLRLYTSHEAKLSTDATGSRLTTTYDYIDSASDRRSGLLKTIVRKDGARVRAAHGFSYYANGRAFSTTEYSGTDADPTSVVKGTEYFRYNLFTSALFDGGGSPYVHDVEHIDQNGNSKTVEYNSDTLVTRTINDDRSRVDQTWVRYGPQGSGDQRKFLIRSITDENNLTTAFRYGRFDLGRNKERKVGAGNVTWQLSRSYDYWQSTTPHGVLTETSYVDPAQANGRRDAVGTVTVNGTRSSVQTYYSGTGNVATVQDPAGNITSFTYTPYGQIETKRLPNGNVNGASNTRKLRYTTFYEYNPSNGNLAFEKRYHRYSDTSLTTVGTYTYDTFGNPKGYVNGEGDSVSYAYDQLGRKRIEIVDANGLRLQSEYRYLDELMVRARDPLGHYTTTSYDLGGRPTQVVRVVNGNQVFKSTSSYDAFGNLVVSRTWAVGNPREADAAREVRYVIDARNRTTATLALQGGYARSMFDGAGQVVRISSPRKVYATDVTQQQQQPPQASDIGKNRYGSGPESVAETSFDEFGYAAVVTDPAKQRTVTTYNSFGEPTQVDWYGANEDGTIATSAWRTTKYGRDALGRVIDLRSNTGQFVVTHFNPDGNPDSVTSFDMSRENVSWGRFLNFNRFTVANVKGRVPRRITVTGYDPSGRATEVTQRGATTADDRMSRVAYDRAGRVVAQSDPRAAASFADYDAWYNAATAGASSSVDFTSWTEYDKAGRVSKQYQPLVPVSGSATQNSRAEADYVWTTYDAGGRPKDVRSVWGSKSTVHANQTVGHVHYDYDDVALKTTTSRMNGANVESSTREFRSATGEVTKVIDGRNYVTSFAYDDLGRLVRKTLPEVNGKVANYRTVYDVAGNVMRTTAPSSNEADAGLVGVSYYDVLQRPIAVVQLAGENAVVPQGTVLSHAQTKYAHGDAVQVASLHSRAKGEWVYSRFAFDNAGRATATFASDNYNVDPTSADQISATQYNWFGEKVVGKTYAVREALTDAATSTRIATTTYTPFGEVKRVEQNDPDGTGGRNASWTEFKYDKAGNQTDVFAPLSTAARSHTDYDGRNRVVTQKQVNTSGSALRSGGQSYFYYPDNTVRVETDPAGNVTSHTYDVLGRLTDTSRTVYGLGSIDSSSHRATAATQTFVIHREYDDNDNLITVRQQNRGGIPGGTNGDPLTISYGYDPRNRRSSEQWNITVNNSSGASIPTGWIRSASNFSYTYDNADRVLTIVDLSFGSFNDDVTEPERNPNIGYQYDVLGHVTKEWQGLSNPTASPSSWTSTRGGVARQYNTDGTLDNTQAYRAGGLTSASQLDSTLWYAYDALGHVREITQTGGSGTSTAKKVVTYVTNQGGEVSQRILTQFGASRTDKKAMNFSYAYDNNGVLNGIVAPTQADNLTYKRDDRGRITAEDRGTLNASGQEERRFGYGADDQLTNDTGTSYGTDDNYNRTSGPRVVSNATGAGNRLKEDSQFTYDYDNVGNLYRKTAKTGGTIWRYSFDGRDRLIGIVKYANATAESSDTRLQVIRYGYDVLNRRISKSVDGDGDGNANFDRELYSLDGSNMVRATDGAGQLRSRYFFGAGVDDVLAEDDPTSQITVSGRQVDKVRWFAKDQQGSIRAVYSQNGSWSDALNATRASVEYDAFGNLTFGTSSLRRFGFTGQQRDVESGMWFYKARYYDASTGKFISDDPIRQGTNVSAYVFNNPVNLNDPSGMAVSFGSGQTSNPGLSAGGRRFIEASQSSNVPLPIDSVANSRAFVDAVNSADGYYNAWDNLPAQDRARYVNANHYVAAQMQMYASSEVGTWLRDHAINGLTTNSPEGQAIIAANTANRESWERWQMLTGADYRVVGFVKGFASNAGSQIWGLGKFVYRVNTDPLGLGAEMYSGAVDSTSAFMAAGMVRDGDSNWTAALKGTSYMVSSAVGAKDIGEAWVGVDITTARELNGWERAERASGGVSKLAFSAAGLRAAYDPVLVTGKLDSAFTVYHGTSVDAAASIRSNGIDLSKAGTNSFKGRTDFGNGFYTTTDYAQAADLAAAKFGANAEVMQFRVSNVRFGQLNNAVFESAGPGWGAFVRANRGFSGLSPYAGGFDTVSGPMAKGLLGQSLPLVPGGQQTAWLTSKATTVLQRGVN